MLSLLFPDEKLMYLSSELKQKDAFLKLGCDLLVGKSIADYFTDDIKVIHYREELFRDFLLNSALTYDFKEINDILKNYYSDIEDMKKSGFNLETNLRSILSANCYTDTIKKIHGILSKYAGTFKSTALIRFLESLSDEIQNQSFTDFEKELSKFRSRIDNIKSITVGVNLNTQLRPKEAGLISVNDKEFKSGNKIDRFLRLEFKKDEYCCIAPLTSATKEMSYTERFKVDSAVNNAFENVLKYTSSYGIKYTSKLIEEKMSKYSALFNELGAICPVLNFITRMSEASLPLCTAETSDNNQLILEDFYDPNLCLKSKNPIVKNNLQIDNKKSSVIITGPNSGGKTVVMRAVAIAQIFASLGIPIPAERAVLRKIPSDVFVAFAPDNTLANSGRLEQECRNLGEVYNACGENSSVFLDEPFSTTSNDDASELLEEYINKMTSKGINYIIVTTHINNFAVKMNNSENIKCVSLGSGTDKFRLIDDSINTLSTAKDISDKFW